MFKLIDLQKDLQKEQKKIFGDNDTLLNELKESLAMAAEEDDAIVEDIRNSEGNIPTPINIDLLERDNIYSFAAIKKVCTKYRLRCLDSKMYKGELPYEAIQKTKEFEEKHQTKVQSYSIMAPKNFFTLEDRYKDPLLFAYIGNGFYYLIAKWGNDLSLKRRIVMLPFRNILTCLASIAIFSMLISFCLPHSVFDFYHIDTSLIFGLKLWLSVHLTIFFAMMTVFLAFTFHLYPSSYAWDNRHFN